MRLLLLLLIPVYAYAPPQVIAPTPNRDFIIESVIITESSGDSTAVNVVEDAVGLLQIRPIMVAEANRLAGYDKYSLQDRYNVSKSIEMWNDVQAYWNPAYDLVKACKMWNAGDTVSTSEQVLLYIQKTQQTYDSIKRACAYQVERDRSFRGIS
jgi:hypothetical protein